MGVLNNAIMKKRKYVSLEENSKYLIKTVIPNNS
jgi:hypothetical protein